MRIRETRRCEVAVTIPPSFTPCGGPGLLNVTLPRAANPMGMESVRQQGCCWVRCGRDFVLLEGLQETLGWMACWSVPAGICTPTQTSHAHPYLHQLWVLEKPQHLRNFMAQPKLPYWMVQAAVPKTKQIHPQGITMFGVTALAVHIPWSAPKWGGCFPATPARHQLCPESRFGLVTCRVGSLWSAADWLFPEAGTSVWVDVTAGTHCFDSSSENAKNRHEGTTDASNPLTVLLHPGSIGISLMHVFCQGRGKFPGDSHVPVAENLLILELANLPRCLHGSAWVSWNSFWKSGGKWTYFWLCFMLLLCGLQLCHKSH